MPLPEKPIKYFVRRVETLRELHKWIDQATNNIVIEDLEGPVGVGKTTLLQYFYLTVGRQHPNIVKAGMDFSDMRVPQPPEEKEGDPYLQWLEETGSIYLQVLTTLAKDLFPSESPYEKSLSDAYHKNLPKESRLSASFELGYNSPIPFLPNPKVVIVRKKDEKKIYQSQLEKITTARHKLVQEFARLVNQYCPKKRALIFLDTFCHIQETILGQWLMDEFRPNVPNSLFILGRTKTGGTIRPQNTTVINLQINNFTEAESREYVLKTLQQGAIDAGLDQKIYAFCRGNPLFTAMITEIIQHRGIEHALQLDALNFLSNAALEDRQKAFTLVDEFIKTVSDEEPLLMQAFNAACILRQFTRKGLEAILASLPGEYDTAALWKYIRIQPIVEKIRRGDEEVLVIHEFFATMRTTWLQEKVEDGPEFIQNIHELAARYYGEVLQSDEEESSMTVWERWHVYEKEAWQFLNERWLYHLTANSDESSAALELATRFFDAYFWWGDYITFPYCKRLLDDITSLCLERKCKTHRWLELLQDQNLHYVPTRFRGADTSWAEPTRIRLFHMVDLGKLTHISEEDAPRWHLKALLENYFAETYRVENPAAPEAEQHFKEAIQSLINARSWYQKELASATEDKKYRKILRGKIGRESWCLSWIRTWLACLYAERGEVEKTLAACAEAEAEIMESDPEDIESRARVHCARGDAYFTNQSWEKAIDEYARYAHFASGFLVEQYSSGGDTYTLEFFREMIERIAEKFIQLAKTNPTVVASWWQRLVAFWSYGGSSILPKGLPIAPGAPEGWITLDEYGHALTHLLPLPVIPVQPPENFMETIHLEIPGEVQDQFEKAFFALKYHYKIQ